MKSLLSRLALIAALAFIAGCHGWRTIETQPTVKTRLTENRELRMQAIADDLTAKVF